MCGIAGFAGSGSRADIQAMTDRLRHRGPDGEGFFVDPQLQVFLGHRRLAIVDIAGGQQPMWNEDDTIGVVYNGEIYNAPELRAELERAGHTFHTDHCDTEILVHGYEQWGDDLPARLNGMFAFAIFDKPRRQLFLARDRFGEKPLFYLQEPGLFAFASEIGALAAHGAAALEIQPQALAKFMAYGFLPAPHTPYRRVHKLAAGSLLRYRLDDAHATTTRYWRFRLRPDDSLTDRGEARLADELRQLLLSAVRRRLVSDVPLGMFLSGGIDSSTILWAMSQSRSPTDIKCFTIGFNEPSFDETSYAATAAQAFGCDHRIERLDLGGAARLIPEVLARMDEPLGDASLIPTYLLSRFTRKHVSVALSGDGGDELFAGYDPFKALRPASLYQSLVPDALHRVLQRAVGWLPISTRNMSLDFKLRRTLLGLSYRAALWNPVWLSAADPVLLDSVMECAPKPDELYSEAIELWDTSDLADPVDRSLEFFTNFYLQDDILCKADRASMMSSLESRAVFLDNDLVDFCARLPNRFKLRHGQTKYLLKRAMRGLLPDAILDRKKKGFGIPLAQWLKTVPADPPMAPLPGFRLDRVRQLWAAHRGNRADYRLALWSWLSLQYSLKLRSAS